MVKIEKSGKIADQTWETTPAKAAEEFSKFCEKHFDPEKEVEQQNDGPKAVFTAPNGDKLTMIFASAKEREEMVG